MSLYIGKDKDGRSIIHATSITQSVDTLKNGINANTIFHTDMAYYGFSTYPVTVMPFTGSTALMTDPSSYFMFVPDAECRSLIASGHHAIPVYDLGNESVVSEGYCFANLEYPTAGVNLQGKGMMYSNTAGTAASLQPSAAFPCPVIYFNQPSHWEVRREIYNAYILVSNWNWKTETFTTNPHPTSIHIEPSGIYFDGKKQGFIRLVGRSPSNSGNLMAFGDTGGFSEGNRVHLDNKARRNAPTGVRIQRYSETSYELSIGDEILLSPSSPFIMSSPKKQATVTYPSTTVEGVVGWPAFRGAQDTNVTWNKNDVFLFRVTCPTYGADYMVGPLGAELGLSNNTSISLLSVGKVRLIGDDARPRRASVDLGIRFEGTDPTGSTGYVSIGYAEKSGIGVTGTETITLPATTVRIFNLSV